MSNADDIAIKQLKLQMQKLEMMVAQLAKRVEYLSRERQRLKTEIGNISKK